MVYLIRSTDASQVTAMGREALQRTVDLATTQLSLGLFLAYAYLCSMLYALCFMLITVLIIVLFMPFYPYLIIFNYL
jgi:uncharacterized membrane protein